MFFRKKFFNKSEEAQVIAAIQKAERACSGEIRVFVEPRCKGPIAARTKAVFAELAMEKTAARNGVLLYIAYEDRKFAIFGDEGIHQKAGQQFWNAEIDVLKKYFSEGKTTEGVCVVIEQIGQALAFHFPYTNEDRNELPDAPVYGR